MEELKTDVVELKENVSELKTDVEVLKTDVTELKVDTAELKTDTAILKTNMSYAKADGVSIRMEISDMHTDLGGKIEAVRLTVVNVRDKMDTLEFALQTEISKTYDLAQENAKKLKRLLLYKDKIIPMPV